MRMTLGRRSLNFILIFFFLPISVYSQGDYRVCFKSDKPLPGYLRAMRDSNMSAYDLEDAIQWACHELDDPIFFPDARNDQTPIGPLGKAKAVGGALGSIFISGIPTGLMDIFGQNKTLSEYKQKLEQISKIQNPRERIRKVYELVVENQGKSDKSPLRATYDSLRPRSPSGILNKAKATGEGGVCRNFATLLDWSLMQVNMSPTLPKYYSTWKIPDENSFVSEIIFDPWHEYVEVKIPNGKGTFESFQLDPTIPAEGHTTAFLPLYPRHQGLNPSQREQLWRQCRDIRDCILYSKYKDDSSDKSAPSLLTPPRPNIVH